MDHDYPEGWWGKVDGARRDAPFHLMVKSEDFRGRESACRGREFDGGVQPGRQLDDKDKCGKCVELIMLGEFPGIALHPPVV